MQTEDSALSQNVDRQVWTNMPLEDRSQNEFMGLVAGAEPASEAMLGTDRGPAVNGTRSGTGNFMVEGFTITTTKVWAALPQSPVPVVL